MPSAPNRNHASGNRTQQTFGRNLMAYIQNRLPYNLEFVHPKDSNNPKYDVFKNAGTRKPELLAKHSVSSSTDYNNMDLGMIEKDRSFADVMYANVQNDKGARLRDYRVMAAYSEVADALDEICDEFVNLDDKGMVLKAQISNLDLEAKQKETIEEELKTYIDHFDLKHRGWQYFRQFIVEGEIFFELIIHQQHTDSGVLGVINVPSELIDPVYNNIQNMLIKGYIYKKPVFDPNNPAKIEKYDFIPMDQNQIVYVNSGVYNEDKTSTLPFLENARRSYRQLSLIEDAIVIYRLVRAPERLVFNVDVGTMSPPKAEAYLRKLSHQYWSTKTYDSNEGDISQKFTPQSMLDAFWFAKRQGSEGTSVEQLPGGANLGELADLMYFIKKLYRSLKVPQSRVDPQDAFRDGADILREELKFARFIIRQQQRFANGMKKGFITHLKLKEIWKEFDLHEDDFDLEFNVPTNFYELRESQRLEMKAGNYDNLASNEFISPTMAQKKYLGWSDKEILANREFMRTDSSFRWELAQIEAGGPNWQANLANAAEQAAGGFGGEGGGGGFGGIPDFGGGPALDPEEGMEGEPPAEDPPGAVAPAEPVAPVSQ
jgi:hypothetical protein